MHPNDRRIFQRLRLPRPILGTLDGQNTLILDLGVIGAFVEHYGVVTPKKRCRLQFKWQREDIEIICDVARTDVVRRSGAKALSHTGLRFVEAIGRSEERLNDLIGSYVGNMLAAQKANAEGVAHENELRLVDMGGARRVRVRGLVRYRLRPDGTWVRSATIDRRQPPDGFTVAAYEYESDLEALCLAYEVADEEGRSMIRLVSELSVNTVEPL
ncbi:MAG TPA: PilZ domain-containing protein [Thermoanaerobaculia bacterium]|nr:PilZ domain-containing protein [Thermoanaerobaculia bacterium]